MPKRSLADLAALFSAKAHGDEIALNRLLNDSTVPEEVLGFHAQQAVEKLLKAVLAQSEIAPPRSHDIAYLITLLEDAGVSPPPDIGELEALNPWATEFRYGDVLDEALDRVAIGALVQKVRNWADALTTTT